MCWCFTGQWVNIWRLSRNEIEVFLIFDMYMFMYNVQYKKRTMKMGNVLVEWPQQHRLGFRSFLFKRIWPFVIEFQCMARLMFEFFYIFVVFFFLEKKHFRVRWKKQIHGHKCISYFNFLFLFTIDTDGPLSHYIIWCLVNNNIFFCLSSFGHYPTDVVDCRSWLWLRQVLMLSLWYQRRIIIRKPSEHRRWKWREEKIGISLLLQLTDSPYDAWIQRIGIPFIHLDSMHWLERCCKRIFPRSSYKVNWIYFTKHPIRISDANGQPNIINN